MPSAAAEPAAGRLRFSRRINDRGTSDRWEKFCSGNALAGVALAAGLAAALSACGTSTTDRALSGAGIGAGAGAATGAITGGSVVGGALLGGAAGAAIGGLTDPDDVNLGRPIWRR
jgi:hypothetical protein